MTTTTPSAEDLQILAVLDEHAARTHWAIEKDCQGIEAVYAKLHMLGETFLVRRIADPKKECGCWVRTPAGTEALNTGRTEP